MRAALGGAFAAILLAAGSAHAAEGGMPQLNVHDFAPQLAWLAIAFVALGVWVMVASSSVPGLTQPDGGAGTRMQMEMGN